MTEYIKREDALRILENGEYWPIGKLEDDVLHLPAADVAEVRHGWWVKTVPGDGENYCSVCHAEQPWFYGYGYYDPDFC